MDACAIRDERLIWSYAKNGRNFSVIESKWNTLNSITFDHVAEWRFFIATFFSLISSFWCCVRVRFNFALILFRPIQANRVQTKHQIIRTSYRFTVFGIWNKICFQIKYHINLENWRARTHALIQTTNSLLLTLHHPMLMPLMMKHKQCACKSPFVSCIHTVCRISFEESPALTHKIRR